MKEMRAIGNINTVDDTDPFQPVSSFKEYLDFERTAFSSRNR